MVTRQQLKDWFKSGLRPLQTQYHEWIDSFLHKQDAIPISQITNLDSVLQQFVTNSQITNLMNILLPTNLAVNGTAIFTVNADLLELIIFEVSVPTLVSVTHNSISLVNETIDVTTSFRLDRAIGAQQTIIINTSSSANLKIYKR
jgi:hypothetical protein